MVFFIKLGLKNAWRNMGRSIAAILAMTLACAALTYTISLGRGRIASIQSSMRSLSGGDISIYSELFDVGNYTSDVPVRYNFLNESYFTDINYFHEENFNKGYLTLVDQPQIDLNELMNALADYPGVRAISPRYQLPALRTYYPPAHRAEDPLRYETINLRGRSLELDAMQYTSLADYITVGRWFEPEDDNQLVCILSAFQPNGYLNWDLQPGDTITLSLPRVVLDFEGNYACDFTNIQTFDLEIIGLYGAVSRKLTAGAIDPDLVPENVEYGLESIFWEISDAFIPQATWQQLWKECSDLPFKPQQLSVLVEDLNYVNDTLNNLRRDYPQVSSFSVVDQAERIQRMMQHETRPMWAPESTYFVYNDAGTGGFIQEDLRVPIMVALFCVAALLVASHLLILVSERKNEIAVLKAIGSLRIHIMTMVLAEALCITLISGIIGFIVIRVQMLLNQLAAGSGSLLAIMFSIITELIMVLGISIGAALIFGSLPALRTARLPVMGVLRDE